MAGLALLNVGLLPRRIRPVCEPLRSVWCIALRANICSALLLLGHTHTQPDRGGGRQTIHSQCHNVYMETHAVGCLGQGHGGHVSSGTGIEIRLNDSPRYSVTSAPPIPITCVRTRGPTGERFY